MSDHYDPIRLAELRDAHAEKVEACRRSGAQVREAAKQAARARAEAPPVAAKAPKLPRHAYAVGMAPAPSLSPTEPNPLYSLPLDVLRELTPDELTEYQADARALSRIIAAETRLQRLRAEHAQHLQTVRDSNALMARINQFATEHQL